MTNVLLVPVLVVGWMVHGVETARADDPGARETERREEQFLGERIEEAATGTRAFRYTTGSIAAASGVSLLTLGVVRLVQDPSDNQVVRGAGLLWLGAGAASLATGLILLARKSPEEDLRRRWERRLAEEGHLSDFERGSFAGELRAAAEFRRRERLLVRWTSLAGASAGLLSMALMPAANNLTDASRRNIIIISSIFAGVGFLNFGLSFQLSAAEYAWKNYEEATPPGRRVVQTSVAPVMHWRGGGVALVGVF